MSIEANELNNDSQKHPKLLANHYCYYVYVRICVCVCAHACVPVKRVKKWLYMMLYIANGDLFVDRQPVMGIYTISQLLHPRKLTNMTIKHPP